MDEDVMDSVPRSRDAASSRLAARINGPWWTAADQAEQDLLVHELVDAAWEHRGKPGFTAALDDALEAILAWQRRRLLLSRAAYLRAAEDVRAAKRRAAPIEGADVTLSEWVESLPVGRWRVAA